MAIYAAWSITAVKTADYTAVLGQLVRCNPTGGAFQITLPSVTAADAGRHVIVKNQSASTNNITVIGQGGTTIEGGASTISAVAHASLTFVYDGVSDWMIT